MGVTEVGGSMPRQSMEDEPENHRCENCGEHQATTWWVGHGGTLAASRFYMQAAWCDCCMLKAQVGYARERAAALAVLEQELADVKCIQAHPELGVRSEQEGSHEQGADLRK